MTEAKLKWWLSQHTYTTLVSSFQKYSCYDCYDILTGHIIELKCRTTHYNTMILEKKKYDAMIATATATEIPVYICSTPKGIWRFNLLTIIPNWRIDQQPRTTFSITAKIDKEVTYINIADGLKL